MSLTLSANHHLHTFRLDFGDEEDEQVSLTESQNSSIVVLQELFPAISKDRILRAFVERDRDLHATGQYLLQKAEEGFSSDEDETDTDYDEEGSPLDAEFNPCDTESEAEQAELPEKNLERRNKGKHECVVIGNCRYPMSYISSANINLNLKLDRPNLMEELYEMFNSGLKDCEKLEYEENGSGSMHLDVDNYMDAVAREVEDAKFAEMLQQQQEEELVRQIELDAEFAEKLSHAENQPIPEPEVSLLVNEVPPAPGNLILPLFDSFVPIWNLISVRLLCRSFMELFAA